LDVMSKLLANLEEMGGLYFVKVARFGLLCFMFHKINPEMETLLKNPVFFLKNVSSPASATIEVKVI
jgi:hypothetical protein